MENLLSDQIKIESVTLKHGAFLNFAMNKEKLVDTIFKYLVNYKSMSKEIPNSVKSVGTRPGTMYRLCKVHKQDLDGCPPFRPILSALHSPTHNFATFQVPI